MPPPKDVGMQLVASWGGGKVARWQEPPVGGAPVGGVDGSVKKLQGKTANGEWQRQRFERDPHKGGKTEKRQRKEMLAAEKLNWKRMENMGKTSGEGFASFRMQRQRSSLNA